MRDKDIALILLTEVRDACLYEDDGFTGVTTEPTIDAVLFERINNFIKSRKEHWDDDANSSNH